MNGLELSAINEKKDLGVFNTDDFAVSKQCSQAYLKASRVLGMIRRTITSRNKYILRTLYPDPSSSGVFHSSFVSALRQGQDSV